MATRIAARFGREQASNPRVPAPQVLVLHDPAGYEQRVPWANVDIRRSFPLEGSALSGMRPDTQLLMLIAEGSVGDPNSLSTVPRLWGYVPAIRRKKAYIVPHQCVKRVDGVDDYSCPTGNFDPNSTTDIHTENQHLYYSLHDAGKNGATPVGWRGLFDPTVDCIREAFSGQVQPHCSGALETDMGEWIEDGVVVSPARSRIDYTPGPFTP